MALPDPASPADPVGDPAWWDHYFANGGGWEQNGGRQQTRRFAEAFCSNVKLPGGPLRILDVGCAIGDAISVFRRCYPEARLFGMDASSVAVERCKATLGHEAEFFVGTIETLQEPFDVIYISNVLEHFADYQRKARLLSARCSRLCVMVPFDERLRGARLRPDPTRHHQWTFDEESFDFLLHDGLATQLHCTTTSCPGAWAWTQREQVVARLKNPLRRLLGKPLQVELLQAIFDIRTAAP